MSEIPPVVPEPAAPVPPTPAYQPVAPQPYGYAQPGAAYPGYGQPGYPAGYVAPPRTNPLAIVSLCLSLATFFFGITAIGGIITGHIALSQIKRTGENGRGLALAGVIIGWVLFGLGVLAIIAYILFVVILFGTMGIASQTSSSVYSS